MSRKPFARLEDVLGAIALIAAFFMLGVFDFKKEDPLVEAGLRAASGEVIREARHAVKVEVDGRDLTLTGLVDSEAEKTRLLNGLRQIEGHGSIDAEVKVLDPAVPFVTSFEWQAEGGVTASGSVPTEAARTRLSQVFKADLAGLELASGAPGKWLEMAALVAQAAGHLEAGRVVMEDHAVTLEATALTPLDAGRAERLLEAAPAAFNLSVDMDLLDDGSPMRLSARRSVEGNIRFAGKLPEGMTIADYDLSEVARSPVSAPVADWDTALRLGVQALSHLRIGHLSVTGRSLSLNGEAWSDRAMAQVQDVMAELPEEMIASVDVIQMDDGQPFDLTVTFDGAKAEATGKVPNDLNLRTQGAFLGHPMTASDMTLAQVSANPAWWDAATRGLEALGVFDAGEMRVRNGRLRLSGQAFGPDERARIEAALRPLADQVVVDLDLTLKDDGSPARLLLEWDGKTARAKGKLPEEMDIAAMAETFGAPVMDDGIAVAYLPVKPRFSGAVDKGVKALALAEQGKLSIDERQLRLDALLRDPDAGASVKEIFGDMPEGYTPDIVLDFLDDGRPFYLTMQFDGQAVVSAGKVPRDLGVASQGAIFGREVQADDLSFADVLASPEWWGAARAGIVALSMLERGALEVDSDVIRLRGRVSGPRQRDIIERRLSYLPEGFTASVELTVPPETDAPQ
ncbi:BON domain-containing protein [Roseovarius sp. MMSF_3281]|uniref:BON domain-containing protein n=1 Tax=Roseovarius sp. MMSF_3281 TaxID=3046694 RepID=UPI00273F7362|nr:BON domain-containing protein [Roseovarius sp. MMSF_3281]